MPLCTLCNQEATIVCPFACGERYCSLACEFEADELHGPLCTRLTAHRAIARPTNGFRAIKFIKIAEFCYINAELALNNQIQADIPLVITNSLDIKYDCSNMRPLPYSIRLRFTTEAGTNDLDINECFSQGLPGVYWRGPVLAYGVETFGNYQKRMKDLDMASIRIIGSFIEQYFSEMPGSIIPGAQMVQAIKVHRSAPGQIPFLEIVQLPSYHPIFFNSTCLVASLYMGMALIATHVPNEKGHNPYAALFRDYDIYSGAFGLRENSFHSDCGSFYVARGDKKPLRLVDFRAFVRQCLEYLDDLIKKMEELDAGEGRDAIVNAYTKALTAEHFSGTWRETLSREWKAASEVGQFYSWEEHPHNL
ncbi:hypothetical protein E2P81_ATG03821 [Venturia nashicola]|nr:hypothetical protein E2P81_ATG03821 [Venturia nashicola]